MQRRRFPCGMHGQICLSSERCDTQGTLHEGGCTEVHTFSDCRSRDSTTLKKGFRSSLPKNSESRGRLDFATWPLGNITARRGSNSLRCRNAPPTSVRCIACLHTIDTQYFGRMVALLKGGGCMNAGMLQYCTHAVLKVAT